MSGGNERLAVISGSACQWNAKKILCALRRLIFFAAQIKFDLDNDASACARPRARAISEMTISSTVRVTYER